MSWKRIYRLASGTLPASLRHKHGPAMERMFAIDLERAGEKGRLRRTAAGIGGVCDVLRRSFYERARYRAGSRAAADSHLASRTSTVDSMRRDVAQSMRSLRKSPGFTALTVLTLALGIGANSAIFGIVDAVLVRPLPFPDADRVVQLAWDGDGYLQRLSAAKFQYWRERSRSFDAMATWQMTSGRLEVQQRELPVQTLSVSRGFFDVLGYGPTLGRGFAPSEYAGTNAGVGLLTRRIWQAGFGGEAAVLGTTVILNGQALTIVGVLPAGFGFPYEDELIDVIVPMSVHVDPADVAENWPAFARLGDGVAREQAEAESASLTESFRRVYPDQASERDRGMILPTFTALRTADGLSRSLWMLMGAVTLVLLIACANVANIFLTRVSWRRGELALRVALGATRWQITRLLLVEFIIVGLCAGAAGLLIGRWISDLLVSVAPVNVPRISDVGTDARVILYTLGAGVLASLLCGGMAALQPLRGGLWEPLREAARGGTRGKRMRQGLVTVQSSLSMVLLVGAGLLVATLISLARTDAGFDPDGLIAIRLPQSTMHEATPTERWNLEQRVMERLEGSAVVAGIAGASNLPFERGVNTPMTISGTPDSWGTVEWRAVTPNYFEVLGIRITQGRAFESADGPGGARVAIVNESFADRHFPGESPLGQHIDVGRVRGEPIDTLRPADAVEIVGVASDIREVSLRLDPRRTIYVPQAQASDHLSNVMGTPPVFIARQRVAGANVEPTIARALEDIDATLARPVALPLDDILARTLARERFGATLVSLLAVLALALTALGIHAVLAYSVEHRRREIGIRMAMGAASHEVTRFIAGQGIAPVIPGLVLGTLASWSLSRLIASFLWGVSPADPVTIAAVALLLLGVAVCAAWIPARRAAKLDPVKALTRD